MNRSTVGRFNTLTLLAVLAASAPGCKGCGRPQAPAAAPGAGPASPAAQAPLTLDALSPVIREKGLAGELPDVVVIELARDAVDRDRVGKASAESAVEIEPPTRGVLLWRGPSTLIFNPEKPFDFDARYRFSLRRVETRDGAIDVPPGRFTYEFATPRFAFLRLSVERVAGARLEVNVAFSGAVKPQEVEPFLAWEVDGERVEGVRLSNTESPRIVRAALAVRHPAAPVVRLVVRAGVPSARRPEVRAAAGEASVSVPSGPPVTIHAAHLREGATGFYVEVVCTDEAVKGQRYYWDREGEQSHRISPRCALAEEEAAQSVHLSPASRVSVAPGPGGFRIFAELSRGPVNLTVDAGARTRDGGVLHEAYQASFSVPARRPALAFAGSGRYLPRSAWKSLPVSHLNVDQVELTVRQVPPENLVFWLSDDDERATDRTSDLLLRQKVKLESPPDRQKTTWIDVAGLLPAKTRGVLEIAVAGGSARATSRLLLTGMNLVAKRSAVPREKWKQEVRVWALDIDSTELLSGVEVQLVRKSGKPLGRCATAGADGCRIDVRRDDSDDGEPFALLARKGDDLTYIRYADLKTDTSESDVQGEPYAAEEAYRAAVWTDRGVYRPGDVAHAAAIVRDRAHLAPPAGMPVELQLVDPREKVARRVVARTNEAGLVAVDLPFAAFADTGRYQLVATVASHRVGAHAFAVEEFVPERMKVQAAADRAAYLLGESAGVAVDARYLFGGSAKGSAVELTCSLEPSTFKPSRENQQFAYGPRPKRSAARPVSLGATQGALDEKGHAAMACPPAAGAFAGPARLVAQAAVFESGSGRSSVTTASAAVHPARFYVGLDSGVRKAEAGKTIPVKGVVVDWTGAPLPKAASEIAVELIRLEPEYGYWWDDETGTERFDRHLRPVSEGARKVKVEGGRFAVDLVPAGGAVAYLVRARAGQAQTEFEIAGDGGGWWWGEGEEGRKEQTPRPLRATSLQVELPASVRVGEKAVAKLSAPFRGRALLTVETDHVVVAEWRKLEPGETTWSFAVSSFAPNVYVSAFLVKDPHLESQEAYLPDRAFGVASAAVEPVEFTAPLRLEVAPEVRSSSELRVRLDAGKLEGTSFAVVAAVDEGILQLTRMKSPDPLASIFAKRALGVDTFETVGWTLLVPPQGPTRSSGGDAAAGGLAGRVQPVKPVALWSGVVPLGADGKAEVRFQVPQYRGQLRVMAVTAGPRRMGRASADVTVKDPLVLQATLPRFITHGDTAQVPVFVTNLSGAPQDVKVTLAAEPLPVPGMAAPPAAELPLVFLGKSEGSARLADGASATMVFQVKANVAVGAAKLRVVARAGGHESREELDVPFLPAGPRERIVKKLEVTSAEVDLRPELTGWVPTSERSTFWLTANPYGESFDHLRYLIHYPYGCVEQTTSSTRPLLFVANLVDSVDPALTAGGKLEEMVMAGVHRLLSMQTPSGGLSYWPGGTEPYAWGTAYATHLLLDAQKLGYPVPQDRLDEILKWIEEETGRIERGERRHAWYDEGHGAEPYLHYVLALAGKGQKARIQRLVDQAPARRDGEWQERLYMLQAALWLAGDRRYEKDLRTPDVSPVSDERRNSWSFYSDRRRRGFMLSTFQDLFGNDPAGEPLAARVAEALRQPSGWYTTQELVWGVTGLGKRVGAIARDFKPGRLVADGRAVEPRPARGRASDRTWALARASEYRSLSLHVDDRGAGGKLWLVVASEGVRERSDPRLGGDGLALTRTFRTLDGASFEPRSRETPLAGLLFVEIAVRNRTGERIQNVALVDRIPAGFEIENPRLGRGNQASWIDADHLWAPDYLDVRDDRIALFGSLEPNEVRKVVYAVRAVTAGRFTLPPVEAEAMYDPRIWAREAGGTVTVSGPWKDALL